MNKIYIKGIVKGSIAEELKIEPGDYLISINNEYIKDILDYKFQIFDENIIILIEKSNGAEWELDIEKDENEDIGLIFEEQLIDKPRNCYNKCIFCFMDQLPKQVRDTLLFKDDDYRLSFITGNYVTLTNCNYDDLDRIVKYHLSPINISVHATDVEVRKMMLNNKNAGMILKYIEYLIEHNIKINAQIVLCKGINDDKILDKTIEDLSKYYPKLLCIAIVPVGLTKYREGLYALEPFDKESSLKVINQIELWQNKLKKETGSNIVYLADEFYVQAEKEIPLYEEYEDFPQLEDGIGMMAYFNKEFNNCFDNILNLDNISNIKNQNKGKTISIATGRSAYKFIKEKTDLIENKFEGLKINVYQIENNYFGPLITVSGLITGIDIFNQLKHKELGSYLILVSSMLKYDEDVFLDNMKLKDLENKLGTKIVIANNNGKDFIDSILLEGENI